ncbi:MAG: complex I subunit 1 family protein [Sedimentisphaerales bacterium]|jgi:NADH-quinone oxidoreductase subunit H
MTEALFNIFVFPGFLFVAAFGLTAEYIDRKLYALMQNRVGPPWFQPLADFIKLSAKEDVVPQHADAGVFKLMPIIAMTSILTAFLYIPIWSTTALFSFQGDLVVVVYLLTIPTLTYFLGGWYSRSVYSMIGAARSVTQLFAYEIPLFLSILAPAMLADTWSLSGMAEYFSVHPWYSLFNVVGFVIAIVALLGKLEKVPFDIPEAETEIVAGAFTEYSGRLLALFRMAIDMELVVGASLLAAVFLPFGMHLSPAAGFAVYLVKVLFVIGLISLFRTIFARLRIDQMIAFCWKVVAPVAFLQLLVDLIIKGANR